MKNINSSFVTRVSSVLAMIFAVGGLPNLAAASGFYSVTAIATQATRVQDPYLLDTVHVVDELTSEFVEQLIEDLDERLPTEISQFIASTY